MKLEVVVNDNVYHIDMIFFAILKRLFGDTGHVSSDIFKLTWILFLMLFTMILRFKERRTEGTERKEIPGRSLCLLLGDNSSADSHIDVHYLHFNGWNFELGQSVYVCGSLQYADQSAQCFAVGLEWPRRSMGFAEKSPKFDRGNPVPHNYPIRWVTSLINVGCIEVIKYR